MLDGGLYSPSGTSEHNDVLDRALAEFNEDGTFHTDTYMALREEGVDPDIYLAQLQGSNGLNLYGGDEE